MNEQQHTDDAAAAAIGNKSASPSTLPEVIAAMVATAPYAAAEQIEPLVQRVLAHNPSPYTYTGTQTYVVGGEQDCVVIDPGPNDTAHIAAIIAAVGGRTLRAITCTHTHRDHSPAASALKDATGAAIIGCAPLVSTGGDGIGDEAFDRSYAPVRVMNDGEQIIGQGWSLTALATPGHTSNHLCFALDQSNAIFTGDHVMKWSTSVIVPPDGDMGDYLASLQKLHDRAPRILYPAHGEPVDNPKQFLRGLIGHRRQRERQIVAALQNDGPTTIPAMVDRMYKGLNPKLVGAAKATVWAHLIDLERRGDVAQSDDSPPERKGWGAIWQWAGKTE